MSYNSQCYAKQSSCPARIWSPRLLLCSEQLNLKLGWVSNCDYSGHYHCQSHNLNLIGQSTWTRSGGRPITNQDFCCKSTIDLTCLSACKFYKSLPCTARKLGKYLSTMTRQMQGADLLQITFRLRNTLHSPFCRCFWLINSQSPQTCFTFAWEFCR